MKKKRTVAIVVAVILAIVVAVTIAAIAMYKNKIGSKNTKEATAESYREIQIYDIEGSATVERENVGQLDAYVDMMLQTKDALGTAVDSYLKLRMDEDKYMLLEPETEITVEAAGDKKDSLTTIQLTKGSITNSLENKLTEDSIYEINTPNATMAIRGTTFRVSVETDEDGVIFTTLSVYEGKIACQLVMPDGTVSDETVMANAGVEIRIRGDEETSEYEYTDGEVDYASLDIKVLQFLKEMVEETGAELTVSLDELEQLIEEKMCTVTFTYNGEVFGTQEVEPRTVIVAPKLSPSQTGAWDYDFSERIEEDVTITWKE